jgi:hypothetical protein
MSAARALLAWLWAAVWLRWRLLGKATPTGAAAGGADFQLAPADVPVAGVDYDPDELPPELLARLGDTRTELHSQARLRAERGDGRVAVRWRRVVGVATAALVSLAVVGAGANALVSGSTGVPAVDRLLGIYEANLSKPGREGQGGLSGPDAQPAPGTEAARVIVRLPGGQRLVSVSYVSAGGSICSLLTRPGGRRDGNLTCRSATDLVRTIQQRGGTLEAISSQREGTVLRGFVAADLKRVQATGPAGPLDMHIGRKWKPDLPGAVVLRPFVAVGASGSIFARGYRISGTSSAGDRVQINP